MSAQPLQQARDDLEQAAETADDDVSETLRETAAEFDDFASGAQQADHALLDEHLNDLRQAREQASGDTEERIDRALERAENYRNELDQA